MAVLIKRYANRKLYDTEASRYITLRGISELVRAGKEVRVVDNESGEDITPLILSQIVVEGQKQGQEHGSLPHAVLTELIQKGGDALFNIVRRGVDDVSDNFSDVREGVRRWVDRKAEQVPFDTGEITRSVHETVERVLRVVDLPTRSDIETLNKNVEHLAHALENFEARLRDLASELRNRS